MTQEEQSPFGAGIGSLEQVVSTPPVLDTVDPNAPKKFGASDRPYCNDLVVLIKRESGVRLYLVTFERNDISKPIYDIVDDGISYYMQQLLQLDYRQDGRKSTQYSKKGIFDNNLPRFRIHLNGYVQANRYALIEINGKDDTVKEDLIALQTQAVKHYIEFAKKLAKYNANPELPTNLGLELPPANELVPTLIYSWKDGVTISGIIEPCNPLQKEGRVSVIK